MNYCEAACDKFTLIDDPYNNGRICYRANSHFLERLDLKRILEDPKFLFIYDNVVYFDK